VSVCKRIRMLTLQEEEEEEEEEGSPPETLRYASLAWTQVSLD
jgi:hypothetical protein